MLNYIVSNEDVDILFNKELNLRFEGEAAKFDLTRHIVWGRMYYRDSATQKAWNQFYKNRYNS